MKNHIREGHKSKCEDCNAILGDVFDLESHKEKYHDSNFKNLKPPAACLCGFCDPEEVTSCKDCVQIFKCDDDFVSHMSLQHYITCEICSCIFGDELYFKYHKEEYHGSSLKPPAAADGDKCEEEVDSKASTGKEHTKDGALFDLNDHYEKCFKKVHEIGRRWVRYRLSIKGHITIAKTFLLPQFTYAASVLDPSASTYDTINRMLRSFVNTGSTLILGKVNWINQEDILYDSNQEDILYNSK